MKRPLASVICLVFLAAAFFASPAGAQLSAKLGDRVTNWTLPMQLTKETDATSPRPFIGVTPCRIVDTRGPAGPYGAPALPASVARNFALPLGPCAGLPVGIDAYSLNITVTNTLGAGFILIYPQGGAQPNVSTLNYLAGQTIANAAIVPAGTPNAGVTVVAGVSGTDLIIDINGYFSDVLGTPANYFQLTTNSGGYTAFFQNLSTTCSGACGVFQNVLSGYSGYFSNSSATDAGAKGVWGVVQSTAANVVGVHGSAQGGTGVNFGVVGENNSTSGSAVGVLGRINTITGGGFSAGVRGLNNSTGGGGIGVWGSQAGSGWGGYFTSSTGLGVYGVSGTGGTGVYGQGGTYGVYAAGGFGGTGAKYFIEPHPTDASKVIRYISLEGPESGTYFRGTARIVHGQAVIEVPESFRIVTDEEGLTVQLTAVGAATSMYIVSEDLNQVVVRSSKDVAFHYLVQGVRRAFKGFEPIGEGQEFMPQSADEPMPAYLTAEAKRRLIANGTYHPDGTPNMETATALGWVKVWEQRQNTATPPEPLVPHP